MTAGTHPPFGGDGPRGATEQALKLAPAKLFEFAVSITVPDDDGKLVKEWQDGFAALGAGEAVQKIQEELAREWYWNKAVFDLFRPDDGEAGDAPGHAGAVVVARRLGVAVSLGRT